MILKTIYCDMPMCESRYTETGDSQGFPGWGHVIGLVDPTTGREKAHICPECKKKIIGVLNNGMD